MAASPPLEEHESTEPFSSDTQFCILGVDWIRGSMQSSMVPVFVQICRHVDVYKVLYFSPAYMLGLDSILILDSILLNVLDSTPPGTVRSIHPGA